MLLLPDDYPLSTELDLDPSRVVRQRAAAAHELGAARIGILNVMPKAESYEGYLLRPLARADALVEPVWLRLESHSYSSSDAAHIGRFYRPFAQALGERPLSGLILTGAPVEDLEFEAVTYWRELSRVLEFARRNLRGTLGLCWGGMALARLLGLDKVPFPKKLFGVYANRSLSQAHRISASLDDAFHCAHSRHSGISDRALEEASDRGLVNLLSYGPETGYSIFESSDRRFLMHLGHPEYEAERLVHEWQRDRTLGRSDVERPANFDPEQPQNLWQSHRNSLFANWLGHLADSAQ